MHETLIGPTDYTVTLSDGIAAVQRDTFRAAQTRAATTRQDSIVGMTISNIRLPTATSSQEASGYTGKEFTQGGGSPDAHRIPIQSARMHTSGRGATTLSDGAVSERDTQWLSHAVVKEIQLTLTVEPRQQQDVCAYISAMEGIQSTNPYGL